MSASLLSVSGRGDDSGCAVSLAPLRLLLMTENPCLTWSGVAGAGFMLTGATSRQH